jgi:hypothetical protein
VNVFSHTTCCVWRVWHMMCMYVWASVNTNEGHDMTRDEAIKNLMTIYNRRTYDGITTDHEMLMEMVGLIDKIYTDQA